MNALLLNRDGFQMPVDGWYQIAPLGEFAHAHAGVVQVVDREACEGMVNRFREEAKAANFAGVLVDFDHFSLDGEKRSEAAGWITALKARMQNSGEDGTHSRLRQETTAGQEDAEGTQGGKKVCRRRTQMNADRRSDCGPISGGVMLAKRR